MGYFKKKKLMRLVMNIASIILVLIILFPIIWMFRTTFLRTVLIYQPKPVLFFKPTLQAYIDVFARQNFSARLINSTIISIVSTFTALFLGTMASYGMSRFEFPFSRSLPLTFLFLRMTPAIAALVPVFLLFTKLGLIDTYQGLIAIYTSGAIPMVVWMMWGFYQGLPKDIEESAYIDGCGKFGTFIQVVLPMSKPALAALGILTFSGAWNEFMLATILTGKRVITLPPGIKFLMSASDLSWDLISAGGVLVSLPILVFCITAQRYFVDGLTLGAIKG